jgi:hypothetical protein
MYRLRSDGCKNPVPLASTRHKARYCDHLHTIKTLFQFIKKHITEFMRYCQPLQAEAGRCRQMQAGRQAGRQATTYATPPIVQTPMAFY